MKATGYGIAAAGFAIASQIGDKSAAPMFVIWALLAFFGLIFTRATTKEAK